VLETATTRILSFGPGDQQSGCLRADPERLLFAYTQAMLLPLLWLQPTRVLCLGLGAGSLVTALHQWHKGVRITAVELRQGVIEAAYACFSLPRSQRIEVHCADAAVFLATHQTRYDLILSDLYLLGGAAPLQQESEYLALCARTLKPQGLLALNSWGSGRADCLLMERLRDSFGALRSCPTSEGNRIFLAAHDWPASSGAVLKVRLKQYSRTLGFRLQRYFDQLQVH
jgi:spermidine synthase